MMMPVVVNSYVRLCVIFFFKQKTAYEMRISDWSSDVCSSDLGDDCPRVRYLPATVLLFLAGHFAGTPRPAARGTFPVFLFQRRRRWPHPVTDPGFADA